MKITFVLPFAGLAGGIRVVAIYAELLQKLGHEVFVISQPRKKPTFKQKIKSLIKGDIKLFEKKSGYSYFDDLDVTHKILETNRPVMDEDLPDADVVVATWWTTAERVANLSPSKGAKVYFMQDYGAPNQELDKIVPTWLLPLHMVTISKWLVELIHQQCGEIPIDLVPNSVDLNLFKSDLRSKNNQPTVGLIYRTLGTKGIDIALKAVEIAQQQVPELQLLMFGNSKLDKTLKPPANTNYYFQLTDEQIVNIYNSCDAWLFPSILEGFGLPILEAMACRTPVIGTPAGAAPELLSQGGGILVKPEDSEDMAKAIIEICQMSNEEWRWMSDKAYSTATSYTWDDAAKLFEQALYNAIERTKKGDLLNF